MAYHGKPINEINGGTNQTTYTTGNLLYASGTNTLSKLPIGSSSTVLTVSSGLPSWQTQPTSGPPFGTNNFYEDFLSSSILSLISNHFVPSPTAYVNHPGVASNAAFSANSCGISSNSRLFLGEGAISASWLININTPSDVTNRYITTIGFGDSLTAESANGVYFYYSDNINSGNWQVKTAAASTRTTTSTAVAATGWQLLTITINAAATSVTFSINGVSVGTSSTNIPTALGVFYIFNSIRTAGTIAASSLLIDLFYVTETLTTARA